jgi:multidrug efflux pump subunit AcrA (membrane-fusion protein)
LDREERSILQQKQAIQQLENLLALIPARAETLNAALRVNQAHLKQASRELDKTFIRAPFEGRFGKVNLEKGQVLQGGEFLFEMHGTQAVEIEAQFHLEQLRTLLPSEKGDALEPGITISGLPKILQLTATVRLRHGSWESSWPAEFYGLRESVDPRSRAVNVVVIVEDPYGKAVPGVRPPLIQGMYCEVELCGSPREKALIIPRNALWGDRVYALDEEDRLRILPVQVAFVQEDFVVLTSGVGEGQRIIVSDPFPAIEGMKILPLWDETLQKTILEKARGDGASS